MTATFLFDMFAEVVKRSVMMVYLLIAAKAT